MKIAALCPTYLRPELLGRAIRCFELQDYPTDQRELIVLDDAGQYDNQSGPGWQLVSIPRRFRTLGQKRNALVGLASGDVEAFAWLDDDDVYLPWWLSAIAAALRGGPWARPSQVLLRHGGRLERYETFSRRHPDRPAYHGGWSFRRETFEAVGGYRPTSNGEDRELARRVAERFGRSVDTICPEFPDPFYIFSSESGTWHLSHLGPGNTGYRKLAAQPEKVRQLRIGLPQDYAAMPIGREVHRRKW